MAKSSGSKSSSGGGCLVTMLKIFGMILLISLLLGFGWIAGIIWFLFYRKKLADDPKKQKKYSVIVGILSIMSFFLMIDSVASAPPAAETITISSDSTGQTLDVNTDYIITVSTTPDGSELSDTLSYNVSNPDIASLHSSSSTYQSEAVLHTSGEGTIEISISSGSLQSNTLTFVIIDRERLQREAEEKERQAAEKEAQDAEDALNDEEPGEADTEELDEVDTGELDEADTEELNETEAGETLSEENISEKDASETNPAESDGNTTTQPSDSGSASVTTQSPTTTSSSSGETVWISANGTKYHSNPNCSNMKNPSQVPLQDAINMGRTRCKKCY